MGVRGVGTKLRPVVSISVSAGGSWWEKRFIMALFLNLVWSSWKIQRLVSLKFLTVRVSRKSFLIEGLEYGHLGCAVIANVFGAIFMIFVDVCLPKKEEIFDREAGAMCLPVGSNQSEGVGTVEKVYVSGLLRMGGDSLPVPVWRSVGDAFTDKGSCMCG